MTKDNVVAFHVAMDYISNPPAKESSMTFGPGKYDDVCTHVAEQTGVALNGGAAIVIVIGGYKGNGFSIQSDHTTTLRLPDILEYMAKQIRDDVKGGIG